MIKRTYFKEVIKMVEIPRFNIKSTKGINKEIILIAIVVILLIAVVTTGKVAEVTDVTWTGATLKSIDGKVATFVSGEDTLILEIPEAATETIRNDTDYTLTTQDGRVISILPQ